MATRNPAFTSDDAKLEYASVGLLVDKLPIISERVFKYVFIHPVSRWLALGFLKKHMKIG